MDKFPPYHTTFIVEDYSKSSNIPLSTAQNWLHESHIARVKDVLDAAVLHLFPCQGMAITVSDTLTEKWAEEVAALAREESDINLDDFE